MARRSPAAIPVALAAFVGALGAESDKLVEVPEEGNGDHLNAGRRPPAAALAFAKAVDTDLTLRIDYSSFLGELVVVAS